MKKKRIALKRKRKSKREKNDETLLIIKNQSTQKRGNTRNKIEGYMSKKTKEPLRRVNHKRNIKFLNPILL
jgi:hypothetical protein